MYDYKLVRVEKELYKLFHKGILNNKKIYLFGASDNTRQIIQILRTYKLEPINILDNDKRKQNSYCSRIRVISIEELKDIRNKQNLYIIYSAYWREMIAQLIDKKIDVENICVLYKDESFFEHIYHAIRGKILYDSLINKYGNVPIFVCPYTGTGDIYLIGTFWRQYIEKKQIKDYVFIVISGACKKAAMLFDIKNIEVFKRKIECSYLLRYYMLCPEKVNIKILNDSWGQIHTTPNEWFRGYKELQFMELFRRFVFNLPDTVKPEHPVLKNVDTEIEKIFAKEQIQAGNTVILSPYSNTLADLPDEFWVELAKKLNEAGFMVCTNSSGETEPAVEGTVLISFPLNIAPQFIEKAGYFIGVRSGFCDIVSGTKARKIILYDAMDRFYNGSSFEYFNLNGMGLCEDAVEIQFERDDKHLCEKVMAEISNT